MQNAIMKSELNCRYRLHNCSFKSCLPWAANRNVRITI